MKYILFVLAFSLYLITSGCSNPDSKLVTRLQDSVKSNIEKAKQSKSGYYTFRLSSVTTFDWDKFYVFDEYVTSKQVKRITGLDWNGSDVSSGERRLFFISKNKEVHYIDYAPINFPLFIYTCEAKEQYEFSRKDDDLFAVFEACDKNGCTFSMAPARCIGGFKRFYEKK